MPVPQWQPGIEMDEDWASDDEDDFAWPERFRLAGFGGAALYLSTVIVPDPSGSTPASALGMDVRLLSPLRDDGYLHRAVGHGFVERLATFLRHAAADWHPENSLPSFQDMQSGLELSVVSSTPTRVGQLVRIVEDPDAVTPEFEGIDFETSRTALAQAAVDVRSLSLVLGSSDGGVEPPADWK